MLVILGLVFFTSLILTWLWLVVSQNLRWLDQPGSRSSHVIPTPTSGGVGFLVSFMAALAYLAVSLDQLSEFLPLLVAGSVLGGLGLLDDFRNLAILPRIGIQFLCVISSVLVIGPLPPVHLAQWTIDSYVLISMGLVGLGVWQINFFNFMDGIDGLAASQAVFVLLALAWFCAGKGELILAGVCLALVCALLGFTLFNIPVAKVFMGDTGSNFLGFCLFFLGMLACIKGGLNYWTFLILMSTFVVDSTITLLARLREGGVWYHGHRSHAYQLLAVAFNSHFRVVLVYGLINLLWVVPLACLSTLDDSLAVVYTMLAWLPLAAAVIVVRRRLAGG